MKSDKYQTKYNYETTEHPQMSACFYSRKRFHYLPFICFHFIFPLCIQPLFAFTKVLLWRFEYFNQASLLYIWLQTQSKDRILSYFQSCLKKSTRYLYIVGKVMFKLCMMLKYVLLPIISFDQKIKSNIYWYCKSYPTLSGLHTILVLCIKFIYS